MKLVQGTAGVVLPPPGVVVVGIKPDMMIGNRCCNSILR